MAADLADGFGAYLSTKAGQLHVAGPPPLVDAALRMLIMEVRLPASRIRYDKVT